MRPLFVFFSLSLCLAACTTPTATPLPSSTARPTFAPTETLRPVGLTPSLAPPPPAPSPIKVGYLAPPNPQTEEMSTVIQHAAQEFGWPYEWVQDTSADALRRLAQSVSVVVIDGMLTEASHAIIFEFSGVYFIGVSTGGGAFPPPNLLAFGSAVSREDQAGFLAGMVAGFATQTQKVAILGDPNSTKGRKYRNGFLHGVRYACPKCRVDFIDVADVNDSAATIQSATIHISTGFDVFFAAAGQAGNEALVSAAQNGAWVIGSDGDVYASLFGDGTTAGADRVLTSTSVDAGEAVRAALIAFHDGRPPYGAQPLSAANGALILAPYRNANGPLNALEQSYIAAALARLADGSLETGIDPVTGEEK